MKILVTGAAGFIGSHLVQKCLDEGAEVKAFVRYNSKNSWGWLEGMGKQPNLEVVAGDIRDFDSVSRAMDGCGAVLHLAALIGIPYSYDSPLAYIQTNVVGTYNVLESARRQGVGQIVVTSTSETYGTAQTVPISEEHPLVGQSPYSASKIAADQLAISYHRSFDMPVKIARPFNTYGPRQSARAIIPTVISQLLAGSRTLQLGNLDPTRDLTYVQDTVNGFWTLLHHEGFWGEAVNIGNGKDISIGDLVTKIGGMFEGDVVVKTDDDRVRPDKSEVMRLLCDNSKITSATDWRPTTTLDEGLALTKDWLAEHIHLYKPELYNV